MYEAALDLYPEDAFSLFQTCSSINDEAQQIIYQRKAAFTSQADFSAWVQRSGAGNLACVKTLTLRLADLDMSTMMDPQTWSDPNQRIDIWTLCANELRALQAGLMALPNLSTLTVVPPSHKEPMVWQRVYRPLLASLPQICPQISQLEIHDNEELLGCVPSLTQVAEVTFMKPMPMPSLREMEEDRRKSLLGGAAVEFCDLLTARNKLRRPVSAPARIGRSAVTKRK